MNTRNGGRGVSRDRIVKLAALSGSTLTAAMAMGQAGPAGEQVVAGSASFNRTGELTQITAGHNAIINFQSFNVASGHTVQFIQPDASARVLNRVLGPDPSVIAGTIQANGRVYLVNPAGVTFTNGAVINVSQMYAAAGSMSNGDFIRGMDRFTNLRGTVRNEGVINAARAVLAGSSVVNTGQINAAQGQVVFAAGDSVFIGERGGTMYARVSGGQAGGGVTNTGTISARGGSVTVSTGDVFGMAIRQGGAVQASSVALEGGAGTHTTVSGSIDATNATGKGGSVKVLGGSVAVLGGQIDASGATGGGQVLVGGNWQGRGSERNAQTAFVSADSTIRADATAQGKGGEVVVWSDTMTGFYGTASADGRGGDGGRVETSGKVWLDVAGARVTAKAGSGSARAGLWLLDPTAVNIGNAATTTTDPTGADPIATVFDPVTGQIRTAAAPDNNYLTPTLTANISWADILIALASTNVSINTASGALGTGDITITDSVAINLAAARTLTLIADANGGAGGNIVFNAGVDISVVGNTLGVDLQADGGISFNVGNDINLNGGNFSADANIDGGADAFNLQGNFVNIGTFSTGADPVTLTGNLSVNAATAINLNGAVSGAFNLDLAGGATTSFQAVTGVARINNLATGAVTVNGDQSTTGLGAANFILHTGAVTNGAASARIFDSGLGATTFASTYAGNTQALTLNGGGATNFGGTVTGVTGLTNNRTGLTTIAADQTAGFLGIIHAGSVDFSSGAATTLTSLSTITLGSGVGDAITDTGTPTSVTLNTGNVATTLNAGTISLAGLTTDVLGSFSTPNATSITITGASGLVLNDTDGVSLRGVINILNAAAPTTIATGTNLTLLADTTINGGAGAVSFGGTIGGAFNLILNGSGSTLFDGAVLNTVTSLTNNRTALITVNAAMATSGGPILLSGTTGGITIGIGGGTFNPGTGLLTFQGNINGNSQALVLDGGAGNTVFGGTVTNAASITSNRTGLTTIGGNQTTTTGGITYNNGTGGINLTADTNFSTPAAGQNIAFNGTGAINGGGFALTFLAGTGATTFAGAVSNVSTLVNPRTGAISIGGNQSTTGGALTHAGAVTLTATSNFEAGAGTMTFGSTISGANLFGFTTSVGSGATNFNGAVTGVTQLNNRRTGTTTVLGNQTTFGNGILFHGGPVVVNAANVTFDSGTGDMTFTGLLSGFAGTENVTLDPNPGGATFLLGGVGNLNNLTINRTGPLTFGGDFIINGAITINSSLILSTANSVFQSNGNNAITFNGPVSTTANTNLIVNTNGATTFAGSAVTLGSLTTDSAAAGGGPGGGFAGGGAGDTLAFTNNTVVVSLNQATGMVINEEGDKTLRGTINADTNPVAFASPLGTDTIQLGSNLTFGGSGQITFNQPIVGNGFSLTFLATGGNVTFNQQVTGVSLLDNLRTGSIVIAASQRATGSIRHDGAVDFSGGDTTIQSDNGGIRFSGAITDGGTVTNLILNASDETLIQSATLTLGSLQTDTAGAFGAFAPIVTGNNTFRAPSLTNFTTTGATGIILRDVNGAFLGGTISTSSAGPFVLTSGVNLTLLANTTVTTGSGSASFGGTVNGPFSLAVSSTDLVEFRDQVGNSSPLSSLSVSGAGGTAVFRGNVTTTGLINIDKPTVLFGAGPFFFQSNGGGDITFAQTLDSDSANNPRLTVNTIGVTTFGGVVGTGSASTSRLFSVTTDGNQANGVAFTPGGATVAAQSIFTSGSSIIFNDPVGVTLGNGGAVGETVIFDAGPGLFQVTSAPVTLADDIQILSAGGNIVFGADTGALGDAVTVNGDGVNIRNLEVSTTGATIFRGAIGNLNALGTFVSLGAGSLLVEESTATSGQFRSEDATITLGDGDGTEEVVTFTVNLGVGGGDSFVIGSGATTLADDIAISAFNGNILFGSAAPGDGATIDADVNTRDFTATTTTGTKTFRGAIGQTVRLASFTANGTGLTTIEENAGTVGNFSINDGPASLGDADVTAETVTLSTQGGVFTIAVGPTTLTDNIVITTGLGDVTVNGTVDADLAANNRTLVINSGGTTTFDSNIGFTQALQSVTSDSPGTSSFNGIRTTGNLGALPAAGISLLDDSVTLNGGTYDTTNNGTADGDDVIFNTDRTDVTLLASSTTITSGQGNVLFEGLTRSDGGPNRSLTINATGTNGTGVVRFANHVGGDTGDPDSSRLLSLTVGQTGGVFPEAIIFGTSAGPNGVTGAPLAAGTAIFVRTLGNQTYFTATTPNGDPNTAGMIIGADVTFDAADAGADLAFTGIVNADARSNSRNLAAFAQGAGSSVVFNNDIGFANAPGVSPAGDNNGSLASVTVGDSLRTPETITLQQVRATGDQTYIGGTIFLFGEEYQANDNNGIGNITFGDAGLGTLQAVVLSRTGAPLANRSVNVRAGTSIFFNTTIDTADTAVANALFTEAPQITRFGGNIGTGVPGGTTGRLGRIVSDGRVSLGSGAAVTQFGGLGASPADLLVLTNSNGTQIYNNAVLLLTNVVYGDTNAGDINFNFTIDGDNPGTRSIAVRTRGVSRFRSDIGSNNALNEFVTDGIYTGYAGPALDAGEIDNPGVRGDQNRVVFGRHFRPGTDDALALDVPMTVTAVNGITINDPAGIRLADSTTLRADTGNIVINTTVNADRVQRLFDADGAGPGGSVLTNVSRNFTVRTGGIVTLGGSIGNNDGFQTTADTNLSNAGTAPGNLEDDGFTAGAVRPATITISNLDLSGTALDGGRLNIRNASVTDNINVVSSSVFRTTGNQTYSYGIVNGAAFEGISVDGDDNTVFSSRGGDIVFNGNIFTPTDPTSGIRALTVNTSGLTRFNGMIGANYTRDAGGIVSGIEGAAFPFLQLITDAIVNNPNTETNFDQVAALFADERGGTTRFDDDVNLAGRVTAGTVNQLAGPGVTAVNYTPRISLLANDIVSIGNGGTDAKPAVPPATQALADFITPGEVVITGNDGSLIFRRGIVNANANGVGILTLNTVARSLALGTTTTADTFLALTTANRLAYIQNYIAPIMIGGNGDGTGVGTAANRFASFRVTSNNVAFRGALDPSPNLTGFDPANNVAGRGNATDGATVPVLSTVVFMDLAAVGATGLNQLDLDQPTVTNLGPINLDANTTNFGIYTTGAAAGNGIYLGQNEKLLAAGNLELLSGTGANRGRIVINDINVAGAADSAGGRLTVGDGIDVLGNTIRINQRAASSIVKFIGNELFVLPDQGVDFVAATSITFASLPIRFGAAGPFFTPGLRPQFATVSGDNVVLAGDVTPPFTIRRFRDPLYTSPFPPAFRGTQLNQFNDDSLPDAGDLLVGNIIPFDLRAEGASIIVYSDSENTILEAVRELPFEPTVRRHNREPWFERGFPTFRGLSESEIVRRVRMGVKPAAAPAPAAEPVVAAPAPVATPSNRNAGYTQPNRGAAGVR
jgi:fibronectin-binding autotransporter adhesin